MKKNNQILLYDDACPLCVAYTKGFVRAGLLEPENRKAFSVTDKIFLNKINIERGINEIPLIDPDNNKVYYGIDALLEILGRKIPFIKTVGNFKPIKWFLLKLYKFISYNRKVIVAAKPIQNGFDCSPDFNVRYRLLFLSVFFIFNTLMLFPMHQFVISKSMFSNSSLIELQMAHLILVTINIAVAFTLSKKERIEYLGQVNMLALMVILLSIPLMLVNKFFGFTFTRGNDFYFGFLTFFIIKEYIRRMKYAAIINRHPEIVLANVICLAAFLVYLLL